MDFYLFHLMPYHPLSEDFDDYSSSWVVYPNGNFDPERGHELYHEYLDQLVQAETLGWDGICVNEHHQNTYGTMPNPNIIAGMLAMRTSRVRIAILGNGLPIRDHPQRVAEEIALLDVISNGRIIIGFVRGIGPEYFSMGFNPAHSRERFDEAQELVIKAWTSTEPFEYYSKHYKFRHVNVWPRPIQKPHPPIWCPSTGSLETIEYAAHPDRKYPLLLDYTSKDAIARHFDVYREAADGYGYEASPSQLGWLIPTYVAETDAQARTEVKEHLLWLYHKGLKIPPEMIFPYGYISRRSYRPVMKMWESFYPAPTALDLDDLIEGGHALVGSVDSIGEQLESVIEDSGVGIFVPLLQFGNMPHWKATKNMEIFSKEIMTKIRDRDHSAGVVSPWATHEGRPEVAEMTESTRS